jgi:glycosyltransferase involved in cell wall biosynthesis
MLFSFLKYLKPTHYFTLFNKNGELIYPLYSGLSKTDLENLELDSGYSSELSKQYDLSYQALEKGYIGLAQKITTLEKIPVADEYHFVKKYFSTFWYIYTFVIRLLTFHNPIREVYGFMRSIRVKRYHLSNKPFEYEKWDSFESISIKKSRKVSVIIPTLNRYEYLKDVLKDLELQDYKNFDVIVIDQSEPFDKKFYEVFDLNIKLVYQEEKALWLARNIAVEISDADYLLFFDDDSRVDSDWISSHLKCLEFFNADISSGVSISIVGAKVPEDYSYFKHSSQLDTGNVMIKREVFKKIGLFDRQYEKQRMGDGEFGLRAYLYGFVNISNHIAKRLHLKVGTGGLRQMGSWDGFRPKKWFSPRPIPSVLYQFRMYYGLKMTIYLLLRTIPLSLIPYKYKGDKKIIVFSYLSLVVIWPIILIQVLISWKKATIKLNEGTLIKKI